MAQSSATKQIQYLSGTDVKNTRTWDFYCTGGRNSGNWTKIQVPSHWEQQGFGSYNYGRDNVTYGKNFRYADEKGFYKTQFSVPASWKNKEIYIVFEGSMTDTEVKINGRSAGPVHQGAFYRFKYKITDKLKFGQQNLLEATVSKWSEDNSVNGAERLADFWIFGGIYRPVYLEAMPKENIDWTSIDAKADGSFRMNIHLNNPVAGRDVVAEIIDAKGRVVATANAKTLAIDSVVQLKTTVSNPLLWTAETPNLYSVKVSIKNSGKNIYETTDGFGFRTIEVRKQDGIYINGTKIKMKGVNHHVFWPEYGRATYPEADLLDVKLIKEMNMNAVRCSHYPPDKNFLRLCDSLGLYVIDELTGWQKAYTTKAGTPLVKEMVIRDVNHPSIIFWSNGNEGGHNKELVDDYSNYDLSGRTVIHAHHRPGNAINGIDCNHYEDYYSTGKIVADTNIYMPTEFLHAMNDGGGGAALADFWELLWNSKKGAGGFIWCYQDEGIMRRDENNRLDVNGFNDADGIVGPHREKEGSFYAIREIYSPVHITMKELPPDFNGEIPMENRYHFTNLAQCAFRWELINFNKKEDENSGYTVVKKDVAAAPNIISLAKGVLKLNLPADWRTADALALTAYDPFKNEIYRWVWKVKTNMQLLNGMLKADNNSAVTVTEADSLLTLKAAGISVSFDKTNGRLVKLANDNSAALSFGNGPVMVSGSALFTGIKHFKDGDAHVVEVVYNGNLKSVRWRLQPTGWLEMNYEYSLNGAYPFAGISFSYPENLVLGAKWLGKGQHRVWKNRLQGVTLDVYQNSNNNTHTGSAPWDYPEFKGYFADIVWMEFNTLEGKFTVASPDKDLFVRLFDFYGISGAKPTPDLPKGDISFLDGIPPVGTKFGVSTSNVNALGPNSELNKMSGSIRRTLYFYFGSPPLAEKKQSKIPTQ
ncbi:MAG: glycoside hydrolase family 2 [Bacteroidota bacterium]|nr:glycoside hydrolase family 2 [Bacteroidota bacterium]